GAVEHSDVVTQTSVATSGSSVLTVSDTVTVNGTAFDSFSTNTAPVSDTDSLSYAGMAASIYIDKEVSLDNITWHDTNGPTDPHNNLEPIVILTGTTVHYRAIVYNTGSAPLTITGVTDTAIQGAIPGATFTFNGGNPGVVIAAGGSATTDVESESA